MQRELEVARREIVEARALKRENERLLELLDLVEEVDRVIAKGRLISASISSTRRMATLSVGSASGVEVGMPVRAPEGLVGRILEVGPTTARILLVSDKDNVTPVKRARDGLAAFVTGRGDGTVDIQPINLAANSLKPGDLFITSGNGGLYSPNIPVAFVFEKTPGGALGRPLANPAQVAHVVVQPIFQPDFKAAVAAEAKTGADDSAAAPTEATP
jgi:rod shape-determining protein MreC